MFAASRGSVNALHNCVFNIHRQLCYAIVILFAILPLFSTCVAIASASAPFDLTKYAICGWQIDNGKVDHTHTFNNVLSSCH